MTFYRKHRRVTFDNLQLDKKTGELVEIPTMTKQAHIAECDINNIIKSFTLTGQIAHIRDHAEQGVYADVSTAVDYQEAMSIVMSAGQAFATLPSQVRERFKNDPALFLEAMHDPSREGELRELGLLQPKAEPPPAPKAPEPAPEAN